ncbi:MAG: hypothetical protein LAN59_01065 [Acidobacteriia bacterium]|nr:hypothetical protein [Terriglobia bacterium]
MKRGIRFLGTGALLAPLAASVLLLPDALRADELKLKDGSKISGTIVGFEDNSFKVKTAYGYAVVQRDLVTSISIADAAQHAAAEKKPAAAASPPAPAPASKPAAAVAATNTAPTPVAPASAPVADAAPRTAVGAAPEPIREAVSGNLYTNETYRFQMYKPPGWQVIDGARGVLPGAIAAMGTSDETTYLLIGQEAAGKSLAADIEAAERRLREVMENFRPLGEQHVTVSGIAATERRFRGSVDRHDWSGVVAFVPRGNRLYTIFGMTRADDDLVQIQENVIARAITSLQFTP